MSDNNASPVRYGEIRLPVQAREGWHLTTPLHWHTYYEVELFCDGCAETLVNGRALRMERGMLSIMTPQDFHRYSGRYYIKKFIFRDNVISDDVARLLLRASQSRVALLGDRFDEVERTIDSIIALFRSENELDRLRVCNLVESVCIAFLSCEENIPAESDSIGSADTYSAQLHTVLEYIDEHFREPISITEAAQTVHLCPNYFSRWFCRALGTTFSEYVQYHRVRYAAMLLLSTELSIEEISWQSGYSSPSFFNRTFRRLNGMSPSSYRRQLKAMLPE